MVEGLGDHGCEYMTNGLVVVLEQDRTQFRGGGMSGGIAYVLDEFGEFRQHRCNKTSVDLEAITDPADEQNSFDDDSPVTQEATGSPRAKLILENWSEMLPKFVKVFPHEFKQVAGQKRPRRLRYPVAAATWQNGWRSSWIVIVGNTCG